MSNPPVSPVIVMGGKLNLPMATAREELPRRQIIDGRQAARTSAAFCQSPANSSSDGITPAAKSARNGHVPVEKSQQPQRRKAPEFSQ